MVNESSVVWHHHPQPFQAGLASFDSHSLSLPRKFPSPPFTHTHAWLGEEKHQPVHTHLVLCCQMAKEVLTHSSDLEVQDLYAFRSCHRSEAKTYRVETGWGVGMREKNVYLKTFLATALIYSHL